MEKRQNDDEKGKKNKKIRFMVKSVSKANVI